MEVLVTALSSFEHYGSRSRGSRFSCSLGWAEALRAKGLVRIEGELPAAAHPTEAAGTPSSASPADPASPQTTSNESGDGDTASSGPAAGAGAPKRKGKGRRRRTAAE